MATVARELNIGKVPQQRSCLVTVARELNDWQNATADKLHGNSGAKLERWQSATTTCLATSNLETSSQPGDGTARWQNASWHHLPRRPI